ncbi:divergent polysaccharide deacetylase family protein [Desulfitobacterium sp. AusDCA]|uniref:divergent polysaccharide deacetylase family protein n=1 Tax=Desulfitobacterium sp. AusDCA TaxID=3240383 RepID=UPI003DA6FEF6
MTRRPIILLFHKSGLALLLFCLLLLSGGGWYALSALSSPNLQNKVIVVDPGHGGQDPGAQFGGIQEKNINLAIAIRLRDVLAAKGCKVILTREVDKDFFLPNFVLGRMAKRAELSQRIKMASINQADLFISLHANSFPGGNSYGMETYYQIKSLAGKELAEFIQTELKKIQTDNKRIAKSGDYYLLNQTQIPAVIVEVGFLSNPRERKLLQDLNYQDRIAAAIASGIEGYFHKYPHGIPDTLPADEKTVLGPAPVGSSSFKLYYPALNSDELKTEERPVGPAWAKLDTQGKLQIILNEFLKGPRASQEYFPIQSPQLLNLKLAHGILTLNFSDSLRRGFSGGAAEEEMAIKALVWTTTQVGNISGVKIQINGETSESIGGHISLDQTFTAQVPRGKIALVIDDFGINNPGTAEMLELNIPLTAAVMPNLMFSKQESELIHQKGYEIILHMPMEPKSGDPAWLGPGALTIQQSMDTLQQNLSQALESVPYAVE